MAGPKESGDPSKNPNAGSASSQALEFPFNDSIVVRAGERLPQYDKGPALAYGAYGGVKLATPAFAMVCDDALTPRLQRTATYMAIVNPTLIRLIAHGPMYWPPEKKRKYVFIYENRLGNPVLPQDREGALEWKSEKVLGLVVKPLVNALLDFRDKDLIHGNIHPANLFDGGANNPDRLILGDCLSLPAGSFPPVLYQTIERGMCDPVARGIGTIDDDLYALGATLAVLMRSIDPMKGKSDAEIVAEKMENGSFATLIGKDRLTGSILELLRGLLADDQSVRWTLSDVVAWLEGRRHTPKQGLRKLKANRPLPFNGQKYMKAETLAQALPGNPTEAVQLIDSGEMDQWLLRAMDDEALKLRIERAVSLAGENGRGPSYPERLVTRLAIALSPSAPIRYKNLAVMPEGIGKGLTAAYARKADIQIYQEILEQYFVLQWVDMYDQSGIDSASLISRFDACRLYLRQNMLGYGIERCIYFLNPETHCLGDKIGFYQARTPEEVLFALEVLSASPARPEMLLDRHMIAFLSVRDRQMIDGHIAALSSSEIHLRVLGELRTLSTIQRIGRTPNFPGVTKWLAANLAPLYERIHDRELRKKLKAQIAALAETGSLIKLREKIDNPELINSDKKSFRQNMRYYYDLTKEQKKLEHDLARGDVYGRPLGRQISAIVSFVIGGLIVIVSAYLAMTGTDFSGLTG